MYARAFPTGTLMLFQQTAAPTGWTKQATHDDKALRVVSGTASSGGATAFTSVFGAAKATASYTLTTPDIPSHTHTYSGTTGVAGVGNARSALTGDAQDTTPSVNATGGGGGHAHNLSLDLYYVDVIVAAKI